MVDTRAQKRRTGLPAPESSRLGNGEAAKGPTRRSLVRIGSVPPSLARSCSSRPGCFILATAIPTTFPPPSPNNGGATTSVGR